MTSEEIIFLRGNQNVHDDIWDDRALIRAYDKAVSLAKEDIAIKQKEMENDGNPIPNVKHGKRHRTKPKGKSRDSKQKSMKWKIGDTCKAIYSEDGLPYVATIESLDSEEGTCVVEFVGYGNKETVSISTLTLPIDKRQLKHGKSLSELKSDNSMDVSDSGSVNRQNWTHQNNVDHQPNWCFPPPCSPVSSGHYPSFCMPPPWSAMNCMPGFPSSMWDRYKMASVPPPPPLPPLQADAPDDVLASTLISWYMSGYHTGFYQALRQTQNADSRGHTPPMKKNKSRRKK